MSGDRYDCPICGSTIVGETQATYADGSLYRKIDPCGHVIDGPSDQPPHIYGKSQSGKQRRRELARKSHSAEVLLEPCPRCGARSGAFCRRGGSGTGAAAVPHAERVQVAQLGG